MLDAISDATQREAQREAFPIDTPVYEAAGRQPTAPILCAGALEARVLFFARDLGKDEVHAGEPLIGAAGRKVRGGVQRATGSEDALAHVLLTNTVPYKPPGNKAYNKSVIERFRPTQAALLGLAWRGELVLTLGNKAFEWFKPYAPKGALAEFWADEQRRYGETLSVELSGSWNGEPFSKTVTLAPLPHPSPLNATWYPRFDGLLDARLAGVFD